MFCDGMDNVPQFQMVLQNNIENHPFLQRKVLNFVLCEVVDSFQDGEFGHRESDWSPYSMKERSDRRKKQRQDPLTDSLGGEEA